MTSLAARAALCGLLAVGAACTKPPEPQRRFVDSGLGFSLDYPPGWRLDEQAGAAYRAHLARVAALDAGVMAAMQERQREVISVKQITPAGQVGGRLSVFTADATAKDFIAGYLATLFTGMKDTPTTQVKEQLSGYAIAGRGYEVARLTVKVKGTNVLQELYVTEAGQQAVMFALTAKDEPTLEELKAMMQSVRWAEKKPSAP